MFSLITREDIVWSFEKKDLTIFRAVCLYLGLADIASIFFQGCHEERCLDNYKRTRNGLIPYKPHITRFVEDFMALISQDSFLLMVYSKDLHLFTLKDTQNGKRKKVRY